MSQCNPNWVAQITMRMWNNLFNWFIHTDKNQTQEFDVLLKYRCQTSFGESLMGEWVMW